MDVSYMHLLCLMPVGLGGEGTDRHRIRGVWHARSVQCPFSFLLFNRSQEENGKIIFWEKDKLHYLTITKYLQY